MSICDELKKQAEQKYAEGIDKSIETVAACVIYRIATILAVFIINSLYRRRNAQKATALRSGAQLP